MKGLNGLGWQIHDHLKKYRPKMFQELKAQGKLKQTVEAMQNQANETMMSLEEASLLRFATTLLPGQDKPGPSSPM
jgi:hypothetical protein